MFIVWGEDSKSTFPGNDNCMAGVGFYIMEAELFKSRSRSSQKHLRLRLMTDCCCKLRGSGEDRCDFFREQGAV